MHEIASTKPGKFPRAVAIEAVREVLEVFGLACHRVIVAGSLRRQKQVVGDAEILYIPHCAVDTDLFGNVTQRFDITDQALEWLLVRGVIKKRENVNGATMWGPKNKFAVHVRTGVPIDFFRATHDNWWNYLVCRTGPSESNIAIAAAAERQGMKWHPYDKGFTTAGHWIQVRSEEEVFATVGLPYKEPHLR